MDKIAIVFNGVRVLSSEYFREYGYKRYRHVRLEELYDIIRRFIGRVNRVRVDVRKSLGHVLAEEIRVKYDRPDKDISHVDGFAVRSDDLSTATIYLPVKLRIVKGVDPRKADKYVLRRGETVFVETGHPIPPNADAVIPIEEVKIEGNYIIVDKPVYRYYHVFRRGSDFKAGEIVFTPGTRISSMVVKTLLDLGYEEVVVYRKPRVTLFSVGDELVDQPYKPGSGYLPASTRYLDEQALKYYGAEIIESRIIPDDPWVITKSVKEALEKADLVVTIGGVSMGPRDHSWIALYENLHPRMWWRGVKIFPGRSNSGLIIDDKLVVNQPGLHQSSLSTLILILTPILNYLQGGILKPIYPCFEVCLENDVYFNKYFDHYKIGFLNVRDGKAYFIESPGSYHLKPMTSSNAFTIVEPGIERIRKESYIDACIYPPIHGLLYGKPIF